MFKTVFKILLLAFSLTFLYAWGYIKQQRKHQELINILIKKTEGKVLKEMENGGILTKKDIEKIIMGTKASLFWSKNKVQVNEPGIMADNVISHMLSKNIIMNVSEKGLAKYKIKQGEFS